MRALHSWHSRNKVGRSWGVCTCLCPRLWGWGTWLWPHTASFAWFFRPGHGDPLFSSLPAGSKMQWSTAISMTVFAWLFAAFWSVMPLLGWGQYDYEPLRTCCTLDYSKGDRSAPGSSPTGAGWRLLSPGQHTKTPSCPHYRC